MKKMRILFCSEGFIIDGVASFNLYLSAALSNAGHDVAIAGRWAGLKNFRKRHEDHGVRILQTVSVNADSPKLVKKAISFRPDVIITDARRAFPLALKIKLISGAKLVTVFHDSIWNKPDKKNREISTIKNISDGWVTSEKHIFEQMRELSPECPAIMIRRPITDMVNSTPLPSRDPFRVLCLGRLSGYKSPGFRALLENALKLKENIPSLELTFVGGGSRLLLFKVIACKLNRKRGEKFVTIAGTIPDPTDFLEWSTLVCAGATSAIEGLLSNRPVIAFSGYWMGMVRPDLLDYGIDTHFAERRGDILMREHPEKAVEELERVYREWENFNVKENTEIMRNRLEKEFSSKKVARSFEEFFGRIGLENRDNG
jgi:glycosyltransferase involved in cell wall biosynthesis